MASDFKACRGIETRFDNETVWLMAKGFNVLREFKEKRDYFWLDSYAKRQ